MDYKQQIEEIISASENIEVLKNFDTLARGFAIFYLSLKETGLSEEKATEFTEIYITAVVEKASK